MKSQNLIILVVVYLVSLAAYATDPAKEFQDNLPVTTESFSYRSDTIQAPLASVSDLGQLARRNPVAGVTGGTFGFSAGSTEAQYFLSGAGYAEALALVRGGDYAEAAGRIETLGEVFIQFEAPDALYHYLQRMRYLVINKAYEQKALVEMMSLFQPFMEDFAKAQSQDALTLVQAGAWLVDMSLALSAGNTTLLKDRLMLERMRSEMQRMEAPPGVQNALAELEKLGSQDTLSERDVQHVIQLVRNMQQLLS